MHTPTPELAALVARLDKVERRNRLLIWVVSASVLVSLAAIATLTARLLPPTPTHPPQHVDVSSLTLWEKGEVPTIALRANRPDDKSVAIELSDRIWGGARGHVLLDNDQTAIELWDENYKPRVILRWAKDDSGLILLDDKHRKRVELLCTKDGPVLRLLDENAQPIFSKP
jgi:hypothetical protein